MSDLKPCYVRLVDDELLGRVEPCPDYLPLLIDTDTKEAVFNLLRANPGATARLVAVRGEGGGYWVKMEVLL